MAKPKPTQQQGGTATPSQQQGQSSAPSSQQQGSTPIIRDWASI